METDIENQRRRQLPNEPDNAASMRDKVYSKVNQLAIAPGRSFRSQPPISIDASRQLLPAEQDANIPTSNGNHDFAVRGGIAPVLGDVQENDLIGDATGGDEYYDGDDWYPEGYGPEDYYYHGDGDYSFVDAAVQDATAYPEDVNTGFILQEPYDEQNLDEFGNPMPIESFHLGDPESGNYENVHELSAGGETDLYVNTRHPLQLQQTQEYYETATPGYYDVEGNFISVDEQDAYGAEIYENLYYDEEYDEYYPEEYGFDENGEPVLHAYSMHDEKAVYENFGYPYEEGSSQMMPVFNGVQPLSEQLHVDTSQHGTLPFTDDNIAQKPG